MARRRFWVGLVLCLFAGAVGSSADDPETELKFALGLRDLGYYDLAAEQFRSIDWAKQKEPNLRLRIAEGLADTYLAASSAEPEPLDAMRYAGLAAKELESFLQSGVGESLANRLWMKLGEAALEQGRLAVEAYRRQPAGAEAPDVAAEGAAAFRAAMAAFRKASDGYDAVAKRIEAKTQVNDDERRLREDTRQKSIVANMQIAWAQFRLAQLHQAEKKEKESRELIQEAVKTFSDIGTKNKETIAGLSALLGKGLCLHELGDYKSAIGAFEELLQVKSSSELVVPLRQQAQYEKAASQAALGDYDGAAATLKSMLDAGGLGSAMTASVQMRYAKTLGHAADALRAANQKVLAEAENLSKQKDPAAQARSRELKSQAARTRERYRGIYEQAVRIARELVKSGSAHGPEANLLIGQWIVAGELVVERTALEVFATAENLFAAKQYMESIRAYCQAIRLAEEGDAVQRRIIHDAWIQMGKAYVEVGNYYGAGLVFGIVPRLFPESDSAEKCAEYSAALLGAQYKRGKTRIEAEEYLAAQELLVERFPHNEAAKRAAFRLGDISREQKQWEKAAQYYRSVPVASQYYERANYLAGWCLWQAFLDTRKRTEANSQAVAKALFESALANLRGFIEWDANQPQGSAQAEAARQEWVANSKLLLAEMLLDGPQRSPNEAIAALADFEHKYSTLREPMLRARLLRIRAHCAAATPEALLAAEAELEKVIKDYPDSAQNWVAARLLGNKYGELAQRSKKANAPDEQVKAYHAKTGHYLALSLEWNPEQTVDSYGAVAVSLYNAGMTAEAIAAFQRLVLKFEKVPESQAAVWDARAWIGRCYMELGRWKEAAEAHELLVAQFPRVVDFRRRLAICLENVNRLETAAEQWRTVEETLRMGTPEWFEARFHRVKVNADLNRQELAAQLLGAAAVAYPDLGGAAMKRQFEELISKKFTKEQQERFANLLREATGAAAP